MPQRYQKFGLLFLAVILAIFNFYVFYYDWKSGNGEFLFAVLDVGQGDALFIESPSRVQILIDAGPPRKILSELKKVMSPFDRKIDAMIITHPDQDHIGGFAEVLDIYDFDYAFESGVKGESNTYLKLREKLQQENIPLYLAKKGMVLDMGEETYLEIIFPDRDVSNFETNDGSLVARLVYRDTSFLLTGDATYKTEKIILENFKEEIKSNVLKVGHHGSVTSSLPDFVEAVSPSFALISAGKDNKYGHPHPETLETLNFFDLEILRTDLLGAILVKSDGKNLDFSFK